MCFRNAVTKNTCTKTDRQTRPWYWSATCVERHNRGGGGGGGGGRGAGPFSVTCDWPFLKSVIICLTL